MRLGLSGNLKDWFEVGEIPTVVRGTHLHTSPQWLVGGYRNYHRHLARLRQGHMHSKMANGSALQLSTLPILHDSRYEAGRSIFYLSLWFQLPGKMLPESGLCTAAPQPLGQFCK